MGRAFLVILSLLLLATHALGARMGEPRLVGEQPGAKDWYVSASGEVLIVPGRVTPTVNLWQLAASRWIDGLGIVLLIACGMSLRSVARLWGERHRVGQVHCQVCDYDLRGCAGTTCPECGVDLVETPGARAWPVGGRIAIRLLLIVLVATLWTPLWLLADPFRTWNGPEWFSDEVYAWMKRKNVQWALDRVANPQSLVRIDVATGQPICVISRSSRPLSGWSPGRPLRDARFAMVIFDNGIEIHNTSDGRLVRRLDLPDPHDQVRDAWDTEAGVLCVSTGRQQILRWRWRDGTALPTVLLSNDETYGWFLGEGEQRLIRCMNPDPTQYAVIGPDASVIRRIGRPTGNPHRYATDWLSNDQTRLLLLTQKNDRVIDQTGQPVERRIRGPRVEIWDVGSGKFLRDVYVGEQVQDIAMDSRNELIFVLRAEPRDATPSVPLIDAYDATTGEFKAAVHLHGAGDITNLLVPTGGTKLVITGATTGGSGLAVWEVPILYDE